MPNDRQESRLGSFRPNILWLVFRLLGFIKVIWVIGAFAALSGIGSQNTPTTSGSRENQKDGKRHGILSKPTKGNKNYRKENKNGKHVKFFDEITPYGKEMSEKNAKINGNKSVVLEKKSEIAVINKTNEKEVHTNTNKLKMNFSRNGKLAEMNTKSEEIKTLTNIRQNDEHSPGCSLLCKSKASAMLHKNINDVTDERLNILCETNMKALKMQLDRKRKCISDIIIRAETQSEGNILKGHDKLVPVKTKSMYVFRDIDNAVHGRNISFLPKRFITETCNIDWLIEDLIFNGDPVQDFRKASDPLDPENCKIVLRCADYSSFINFPKSQWMKALEESWSKSVVPLSTMAAEDGMVTIRQGSQDSSFIITLNSGRAHSCHNRSLQSYKKPCDIQIRMVQSSDKATPPSDTFRPSTRLCRPAGSTSAVGSKYPGTYQQPICHVVPTTSDVLNTQYPMMAPDPPLALRGHSQFSLRVTCPSNASRRSCGTVSNDRKIYRPQSTTNYALNPSRASDPFVASLRRYPLSSSLTQPELTPSVDLIQKIITYTQHKNYATSLQGRNVRFLRSQNQPQSLSKTVQTSSRSLSPVNDAEIQTLSPTRAESLTRLESTREPVRRQSTIASFIKLETAEPVRESAPGVELSTRRTSTFESPTRQPLTRSESPTKQQPTRSESPRQSFSGLKSTRESPGNPPEFGEAKYSRMYERRSEPTRPSCLRKSPERSDAYKITTAEKKKYEVREPQKTESLIRAQSLTRESCTRGSQSFSRSYERDTRNYEFDDESQLPTKETAVSPSISETIITASPSFKPIEDNLSRQNAIPEALKTDSRVEPFESPIRIKSSTYRIEAESRNKPSRNEFQKTSPRTVSKVGEFMSAPKYGPYYSRVCKLTVPKSTVYKCPIRDYHRRNPIPLRPLLSERVEARRTEPCRRVVNKRMRSKRIELPRTHFVYHEASRRNWAPERRRTISSSKLPRTGYGYPKVEGRTPEVRYLDEVTKYVKETIRNIYNEPSYTACPKMQRRYIYHKRRCPGTGARSSSIHQNTPVLSIDEHVQTGGLLTHASKACSSTNILKSPFISTPRRIHFRPFPAPCQPHDIFSHVDSENCICEEELSLRVDDAVLEWLKCVPVLAICSFSDKCSKAKTIFRLKANLKELLSEKDENGARGEIIKRLNNLPLWYPYDPVKFRNELADDLLNRLKGIAKLDSEKMKRYEKIISEWMEMDPALAGKTPESREENLKLAKSLAAQLIQYSDLPQKEAGGLMERDITSFVNKILNERGQTIDPGNKAQLTRWLRSALLNIEEKDDMFPSINTSIRLLLENLPELANVSDANKKVISEAIARRIAELKAQGYPNAEIEKILFPEMVNMLRDVVDLDPETLANVAKNIIKCGLGAFSVKENLLNTFENIPELASKNPEERKQLEEISEKITKKFNELKDRGLSFDEIEEQIRKKIKFAVSDILDNKGTNVDPKRKSIIVDQLLNALNSSILPLSKESSKLEAAMKDNLKNVFGDISKLASDDPEFDKGVDKLYAKMAKRWKELKALGLTDDEIREKLRDEMGDELNALLEAHGLNPITRKGYLSQILDQMGSSPTINDEEAIRNVFAGIPELVSDDPEFNKELDRICEKMARKWSELKASGLDDEEIRKTLKEEMGDEIEALLEAKGLDPLTRKRVLSQYFTNVGRRPLISNEEALKNNLRKVFAGIPELASKDLEFNEKLDKLAAKMAKKWAVLKTQGLDDDEIKKKLKEEMGGEFDALLEARGLDPLPRKRVLSKIFNRVGRGLSFNDEEALKNHLKNVFGGIPELPSTDPEFNEKIYELSAKMGKNWAKLKALGLTDDEIRKKLKEEIGDEIDALLEDQGLDPLPRKRVLSKIFNHVGRGLSINDEEALKNHLRNIFRGIPELPSDDPEFNEKIDELSAKMGKRWAKLKALGLTDDEIRKKLKEEIGDEIDALLEDQGLDPLPRKRVLSKIFNRVGRSPSINDEEALKNHLKNVFGGIPELPRDDPEFNEKIDELGAKMGKRWAKLKAIGLTDDEIRKKLKEEIGDEINALLEDQGLDPLPRKRVLSKIFNHVGRGSSINDEKALKNHLRNVFEGIPELPSDDPEFNEKIDELSAKMGKRWAKLKALGLTDDEIRKKLKEEIGDEIDALLKDQGLDSLPRKRVLSKIFNRVGRGPSINDEEALKNHLRNVFGGIPELPSDDPEFNEKIDELGAKMGKRWAKLKALGLTDDEIRKKVKEEIGDEIDALLEDQGLDPLPRKRVLSKIFNHNGRGSSINDEEALKNHLRNVFEGIPELPSDDPEFNEKIDKLGAKMGKRWAKLKALGLTDDEIRKKVKEEKGDEIDALLEDEGLDPLTRQKILSQIFNRAGRDPSTDEEAIKNELRNSIGLIPELASDDPKFNQILDKLVSKMAKRWAQLKAQGLNDNEIKEKLKEETGDLIDSLLKSKGLDPATRKKVFDHMFNIGAKNKPKKKRQKKSLDLDPKSEKVRDYLEEILPEIRPENSTEKEENAQLAKNITRKASDVNKKQLKAKDKKKIACEFIKAEISDVLKGRLKEIDPEIISDTADKLVDKLTELIGITEDEFESISPKKTQNMIITKLQKKFNNLRGQDKNQIKKKMFLETQRLLDESLNTKAQKLDPQVKNNLAEAILIKFMKTIKKKDMSERDRQTPKTLDGLVKRVSGFSLFSSEHMERKLIRNVGGKYRDLIAKGLKGKELDEELKKEAKSQLNAFLVDYLEDLRPAAKEKIVEEIVERVQKEQKLVDESVNDERLDFIFGKGRPNFLNTEHLEPPPLPPPKRKTKLFDYRAKPSSVTAWFRQYDSNSPAIQTVIERLSYNIQRIQMRDLSPEEKRMQIERELQYFTENVAETTTERLGFWQTEKLITKLLTDSYIETPEDHNLYQIENDELSDLLLDHNITNSQSLKEDIMLPSLHSSELRETLFADKTDSSDQENNDNKEDNCIERSNRAPRPSIALRKNVVVRRGPRKVRRDSKSFTDSHLNRHKNFVTNQCCISSNKEETKQLNKATKEPTINLTEEVDQLLTNCIEHELTKLERKLQDKGKESLTDTISRILKESASEFVSTETSESEIAQQELEKEFLANRDKINQENKNQYKVYISDDNKDDETFSDYRLSTSEVPKFNEGFYEVVDMQDADDDGRQSSYFPSTSKSSGRKRWIKYTADINDFHIGGVPTKRGPESSKNQKVYYVQKRSSFNNANRRRYRSELPNIDSGVEDDDRETASRKEEDDPKGEDSEGAEDESELDNLMDILTEEAGMSNKEAKYLAQNVQQRTSRDYADDANLMHLGKINEVLDDLIKESMDKGPIIDENRRIHKHLLELLLPQVFEGSVNIDTKNAIKRILKRGKASEVTVEVVTKKIFDNVMQMSERVLEIKHQHIKENSGSRPDHDNFKLMAAREIAFFLNEKAGEISEQDKQKLKYNVKDTVQTLEDINTNPSLTYDDQVREKRDALLSLLRKVHLEAEESDDELVEMLLQRLENIPIQSSTPRESEEHAAFIIESIKKADMDYTAKVEDQIENWLSRLAIDKSIFDDVVFKDAIVRDLAGDIVDRQKYFQIKPNHKPSEKEELELTRYQIFRWLNKFLVAKDLDEAVSRADDLMNAIRCLPVPLLIPGAVQNFSTALHNEISYWIDNQPQESIVLNKFHKFDTINLLVDRIDEVKGTEHADEVVMTEIMEWLPRLLPKTPKSELVVMAQDLLSVLKEKGFTDNTWILSQDPCKFMEENIQSSLKEWLKNTPLYITKPYYEKREIEIAVSALSDDIITAIKQAVEKCVHGNIDVDMLVLDEIFKHLDDIIRDPELRSDAFIIQKAAEGILEYLRDQQMFKHISARIEHPATDYLEAVIMDWVQNIPVQPKTATEESQLLNAEKAFVVRLKEARLTYPPSLPTHEPYVKEEVKKFLQSIVTDPAIKFNEKVLNERADGLIKLLKVVPIEHKRVEPDQVCQIKDTSKNFKTPSDVLYENVAKWCQDLPIHCKNTPEDRERVQTLKHNLAGKIINKIGSLNLNPEVFYDEYLYEHVLLDELEEILSDLPTNPELVKYMPALKRYLVSLVKDARGKIFDELEAINYKQKLRDAVDLTIHFPEPLSNDEKATYDDFKETIAELFINYLFSPDNDEIQTNFKNKMSEQIDKLCNDYVRRHKIGCCFNTDKLKAEILKNLMAVPIPNQESMRTEVEQLRVKDLIDNWLKHVPLKDITATEKLNKHRITTVVLAKRLYEIEKEKESNPYYDSYSKICDEVVKYLKKLPLLPGSEPMILSLATELKNMMQSSTQTRKFDTQKRKISAETQLENSCLYRTVTSSEDIHLDAMKKRFCRDAFVCPRPADGFSQTEVKATTTQKKSLGLQCTPSNMEKPPKAVQCPIQNNPIPSCQPSRQIRPCPVRTDNFCYSGPVPPCHSQQNTSVSTCTQLRPQVPQSDIQQGPPETPAYSQGRPSVPSSSYTSTGVPSMTPSSFTQQPSRFPPEVVPRILVKEYIWEDSYPNASRSYTQNTMTSFPQNAPFNASLPQPVRRPESPAKSSSPPTTSQYCKECFCKSQAKQKSFRTDSNSDCRCTSKHQESKPCRAEASSGDDLSGKPNRAGPRVVNLGSTEDARCPVHGRPQKPTCHETQWSSEPVEVCDSCHIHRAKRKRRANKYLVEEKCRCEERIYVSHKGHPRTVRDMCRLCRSRCPHQSNLYYI